METIMNAIAKNVSASLVPVIDVDESKCVNCHMCIAVCPVKYCIDGSGEKVAINSDLCIGCGSCVAACTQKARSIRDDAERFLADLVRGEKIVAIAAPALASSFPGSYKRFIGWLKSLGVAAVFDVSFGAELTVKSYLEHVRASHPKTVIAQPCPAIVTFIEIYHPELLPHLAPANSPMLHTIKMVKEFYPAYARHKFLVLSPCAAKRREFEETGLGDYNVTYKSFADLLAARKVDLGRQPESDFDNPPAERAVLFSTPGGLLRTAEREVPGISGSSRKIEGPELVYPYLSRLAESIANGTNPLLVDCLNCEYGCNAGPGTLNQGKNPDEFEHPVELRRAEGEKRYGGKSPSAKMARKKLARVVDKYWKEGLYARTYVSRNGNYALREPTDAELAAIYAEMLKASPEDHLNCASCGYKSCRGMAVAIHNGLNKKENCHLYRQRVIEQEKTVVEGTNERLHESILQTTDKVDAIKEKLALLEDRSGSQFAAIEQSAAAVEEMIAMLFNASKIAAGKRDQIEDLAKRAEAGEQDMEATVAAIRAVADGVANISELITVIHDIADETNMLAMNAAIEAAHAGDAGRSFAVVAAEIRKLAETTGGNARHIASSLHSIVEGIRASNGMTERTGAGIKRISDGVATVTDEMGLLISSIGEISSGGEQVTEGIEEMRNVSMGVKDLYQAMAAEVGDILVQINDIAAISDECRRSVAAMA
jgi:iron only hydrogenase large subunit-like protein